MRLVSLQRRFGGGVSRRVQPLAVRRPALAGEGSRNIRRHVDRVRRAGHVRYLRAEEARDVGLRPPSRVAVQETRDFSRVSTSTWA